MLYYLFSFPFSLFLSPSCLKCGFKLYRLIMYMYLYIIFFPRLSFYYNLKQMQKCQLSTLANTCALGHICTRAKCACTHLNLLRFWIVFVLLQVSMPVNHVGGVVINEIWLVVTRDIHLGTTVRWRVMVGANSAPSYTVLRLAPLSPRRVEGSHRQTFLYLLVTVIFSVSILKKKIYENLDLKFSIN